MNVLLYTKKYEIFPTNKMIVKEVETCIIKKVKINFKLSISKQLCLVVYFK